MRHYRFLLFSTLAMIFAAACSQDLTRPTDHDKDLPDLMVAKGGYEPTYSVFLEYSAAAPVSRVAALSALGATFVNDVRSRRVLALDVPRSMVHRFTSLNWAERVEVDSTIYFPMADEYPWGIDSTGAHEVQDMINKGTGVKIGFLDSGVNCNLSDLSGRIKGGYDFVAGSSTFCHPSYLPNVSHGTETAQVLGAALNGTGIVGMAPEADLYSIRVCDANGCTASRIYSGLVWANQHGMDVVTASIGNCGDYPSWSIVTAMAQLHSNGIPQTWAAGNGQYTGGCSSSDPVSGLARTPYSIAVSAHYK
ncbi:MAG: S8 family peptidase, partial [Acidobacteriota bacterium]